MATPNFLNTSPKSALDGGINDSVTSLDVTAADGADFPAAEFNIRIRDAAGAKVPEVLRVTVVATDTFTVTRGYDNTTAQAWLDGDIVEHVVIAEDMDKAWSASSLDDLTDVDTTTVVPSDGDRLEMVSGSYSKITSPSPTVSGDGSLSGGSTWAETYDTNTTTYARIYNTHRFGVKFDFGEDITIRRVKLLQNEGAEYASGVTLWSSTNGTAWTSVQAYTGLVTGWNTLDLTGVSMARHFKLAEDNAGNYWRVHEIEFYEQLGNVWKPTDAPHITTVSTTEPTSPSTGDVWVNPSAAVASAQTAAARMTRSTDQSILATTSTVAEMTTEDFAVGGVTTTVATGKFTVTDAGIYLLAATFFVHTGTETDFRMRPSVNGTIIDQWLARTDLILDRGISGSIMLELSADDYVQIEVYSASAMTLYGAMYPHMEIARL